MRPGTVPPGIIEAMQYAKSDDPSWVAASLSLIGVHPDAWKPWKKFLRRHKSEAKFVPGNAVATVQLSEDITWAETVGATAAPVLRVPRSLLGKGRTHVSDGLMEVLAVKIRAW